VPQGQSFGVHLNSIQHRSLQWMVNFAFWILSAHNRNGAESVPHQPADPASPISPEKRSDLPGCRE
jgi:hypothetical protein